MKTVTDTLEISRSHQYEKRSSRPRHYKKPDDGKYQSLIRQICDKRPTYGYRRVAAILNRQLRTRGEPVVNHKRVYRLMKMHDLLLQKHTGRPTRLHEGTIITLKSNMRWCSDVFEIACWNRERVRVAFCMDCSDREVLSYIATTGGIPSDIIRDLMAEAIEYRFGIVDKVPQSIQWLSDNGPGYIAYKTRAFAHMMGLEVCTTPYHSPQSNGMAESFIKTFKRDYVYMSELPDSLTVMENLPLWFEDYNENHPHKGLKMMSPREYIKLSNEVKECPV